MLYKYLSDRRLDVIKNLKIRFTQPLALNDPFEGLPLIDTDTEKRKFLKETKKGISELWEKADVSDKTPENHREMEATLAELNQEIEDRLCPSEIGRDLMESVNEVLGVLSLTKSPENLLMWSHYSNDHKGYVLGFDEKHEFFFGNTYGSGKSYPRNVSYTTQRSKVRSKEIGFYEKLLCEKPLNWAYEEEVRVFNLFTDMTEQKGVDKNGFPVFLFEIPVDSIKQLYIGANSTERVKSEILDFIDSNSLDIEVYKSTMSKYKYELEFERVI